MISRTLVPCTIAVATAFSPDAFGDPDLAVARYLEDGELDPSYGNGGIVTTRLSFVGSVDTAEDGVLQPDGKLVVVGSTDAYDGAVDIVVARYLPGGDLDAFGIGGVVIIDVSGSGSTDQGLAVAVQIDGKIVVTGFTNANGSNDITLARLNGNGSVDTSFGGTGIVITDIYGSGSDDRAWELEIDGLGRIIAAGWTRVAGSTDIALTRYSASGYLDTTFGTGGSVVLDLGDGTGTDLARAICLQADGRIVAAGKTFAFGSPDGFVARFDDDGQLDGSFGTGGVVILDLRGLGLEDDFTDVQMHPDGRVLASGYADGIGGDDDFAAVRLTPSGALDTTFSDDGWVLTDIDGVDVGESNMLSNHGRLIVVGTSDVSPSPDFALVGYTTALIFLDGFEMGNMSAWSSARGEARRALPRNRH